MLGYYANLALRSFRRNKVLTALMVLAIALGIGASMTTLTVFHMLSGDPIPSKSDRLFNVQLDPQPIANYHEGEEPESQLTRYDAEALLREKRAFRQTITTGGFGAIEPEGSTLKPFQLMLRFATADFFPMFEVPMLHGRGWSSADDEARARVVVISRKLSEKLFGTPDGTGRTVRIEKNAYRVVGVMDEWRPSPRFYDLFNGQYGETEQVIVPFSTAMDVKLSRRGNMNCFSADGTPSTDGTALEASCTWLQYWVELKDASQAADYKAYLDNYSAQQRQAGRYQRPPNTRLRDVMTLLEYRKVVPGDVRLQMWLAMSFLAVCLINSVGLLLAKFLRRSSEIGVRRALGASRRDIFVQCLVEAVGVGTVGGLLGLGLALAGLAAVRRQPVDYASLAHLDLPMLLTAIALTLFASMLAGLLPAWRAMQVAPALQLKSQ
ncbi:ABC transporter permease [[Pseudomonas] boreopolis]|uniref:ABC transporter permease n=1 Tax=Xanthomonas boreopolis TaxID=86183 RepID=UPI003D9AB8A2